MAKRTDVRTSTPAPLAKAPEVDGLDAVTAEEIQLTKEVGSVLAKFIAGARVFFTDAKALEVKALTLRDESKKWVQPTTSTADEALQLAIKRASKGKKLIGDHWATVTSVVFQFHRRLTARRDRGLDALDEVIKTGNALHNKYTEKAKRDAEAETERRRVEAELRARADRDRELEALEQQRLKDEASAPDLSEREAVYVKFILDMEHSGVAVNVNVCIAAAKKAGYKDPDKTVDRLEKMEKIAQALDAGRRVAAAHKQAQAIREMPLEVAPVEEVKPDIVRAAGATDRTTWTAELLDERALIQAIVRGDQGIPLDVLCVDTTKLNQYARDLHELLDRWPGCRAKKNTGVV